jgi:hypothetical protein
MAIPPAPGASAPGTTVVEHTVYGCRLDEDKINRLIRASAEGLKPLTVELTTVWSGVRLRAGSLADLRSAIEDRVEPGDWRRLENLQIRAGDAERQVVLNIGAQAALVTVESTESSWATGRGELLRKILLYARGTAHIREWGAERLTGIGIAVASIVVTSLSVAGLIDKRPGSVAVAGLIVIVATTAGFLLGRFRERRNRTVLWIDGSIPSRGWRAWTVAERIAALALVVTLSLLVVNILK